MNLKIITFILIFIVCYSSFISSFDLGLNIPAKYREVLAGERIYFDVEIEYPENTYRKDLKFGYEINNEDGLVAKSTILKSVETRASFSDFIVIPGVTQKGDGNLNIETIDKEIQSKQAVDFFIVQAKETSSSTQYLFILGGGVGVLLVFVMIQSYIMIKRKKK